MSWERHGSQRYYYRVQRATNGRLTKTYYGTGPAAQRAAQEDHQKRTQRDTEREERKTWETLDRQVTHLDTLITLLSHGTLVDAGFHQHHRGEWRRRRRTHGTPRRELSQES